MKLKVNIKRLCESTGMRRQNFYKGRKSRKIAIVNSGLIVEMVKAERALQPRLGGKKLYVMLKARLKENGIKIGRDRFLKVLADNGLQVKPLPKAARTTNSRHSLPVFRNEYKSLVLTAPNQAWVSDITYIRTDDDFLYLSLITDAYSRKIVGYYVGDSLETIGCLNALNKAVKELPYGLYPLHHSDRGSQYCSHLYVNKLNDYGLRISMTEEMHCYENALAERVNGILKQEYGLGNTFKTKQQAVDSVDQAVAFYNDRRPHTALNYKTPAEVHKNAA